MATKTLRFPELLTAAGLNVRTLDGWEEWQLDSRGNPNVWRYRDPESNTIDPVLSMWHHTASSGYSPNRQKANMYAGLSVPGSDRLYQSGGGEPTLVIANAYTAPISSGYGQKAVIDLARNDIRNDAKARGYDDSPRYAANDDAWNTEVILDGTGSWIDDDVWEMLITAAQVIHEYMGWSPYRAIGHGQFTARKIDLYDGEYPSMVETMIAFRESMMTQPPPGGELPMWVNDFTDLTWMTIFEAGLTGVTGNGRYYCSNDGTYDFDPPWGEGPTDANGVCEDGLGDYDAKVNAINFLIREGVNTTAAMQAILPEEIL